MFLQYSNKNTVIEYHDSFVCMYFYCSPKIGLSRLLFFNSVKILTSSVTHIENLLISTYMRGGKLSIGQMKAV